jgi:lipopolysaccharide biosynthesis glycosyltransferase
MDAREDELMAGSPQALVFPTIGLLGGECDGSVSMNIVCAIDGHYMRHCAAMLRSLQELHPRENLSVFILHGELDPLEFSKFAGYLRGILPSVSFLQADPSVLEGFPVTGHITVSTYFRLLLPVLLPAGLHRAIFIDSDTIITSSLRELWETPLEGKALAAVADHRLSCADHGYVFGEYFNAGVMLVDLEAWRGVDVIGLGREFAQANPHRLRHWDQDVLNHVFAGQWLAVGERWNACPHLFGLNPDYDLSPERLTASERRAIEDPAILHFAGPGPVKPWNARCTHPLRDRYRRQSAETPWARIPLTDLPPHPLVQTWQHSVFRLKCSLKGVLRGAAERAPGQVP